jgi:hypothetical protein
MSEVKEKDEPGTVKVPVVTKKPVKRKPVRRKPKQVNAPPVVQSPIPNPPPPPPTPDLTPAEEVKPVIVEQKVEKSKEVTFVHVAVKKRLLSNNPNYVKKPYQYTIPMSASKHLPATGQEDILTLKQMRGEEKLRPDQIEALQMGLSPYIINPDETYAIVHGRIFDLSYKQFTDGKKIYDNPRDHAEYRCFTIGTEGGEDEVIAKNKVTYKRKYNAFYIEDKEEEAKEELQNLEITWEAESFVRNELSSGRWKEVLMLMAYEVPKYEVNPDVLSDTRIKYLVLEACRSHPEIVLKLKGEESTQTVFILRMIKRGVIQQKNGRELWYGDISLGTSIESVRHFMNNNINSQITSKWDNLMRQYEGR